MCDDALERLAQGRQAAVVAVARHNIPLPRTAMQQVVWEGRRRRGASAAIARLAAAWVMGGDRQVGAAGDVAQRQRFGLCFGCMGA